MPTLWIDADACPRDVREIVLRASTKRRIPLVFVANRTQSPPRLAWVREIIVSKAMDAADAYLVAEAVLGDLVVTQDVPLAAELVAKGVSVISPRGVVWTVANIGERLAVRDLMTEVRAMGEITGGPPPFDEKAKRAFAAAFEPWVARTFR